MDHPAALHRLQVGVPATVEHSSEAGPETGKWVAETTQVGTFYFVYYIYILIALPVHATLPLHRTNANTRSSSTELHNVHGCPQASSACQRRVAPHPAGTCYRIRTVQREQGVGRAESVGWVVSHVRFIWCSPTEFASTISYCPFHETTD